MSGADYGRQACYNAEDATGLYHGGNKESMTLAEAQRLVDEVLADPWVQKHMRVAKSFVKSGGITVIPGRTRGFAGRRGWKPVICLGPWARQEYIALHEIAHHLTGLSAGHNKYFCGNLYLLVARFMGQEQAETLRRSFGKHNVSCSWASMPSVPKTVGLKRYRISTPPVERIAAKRQTPSTCCAIEGCSNKVDRRGLCRRHANETQGTC